MMGKISRVSIVELINPPMTTLASGFCVSLPIPVDTAAGNKPIAAIKAVITTGRILDWTPWETAWANGIFEWRLCLKTEIRMTPF